MEKRNFLAALSKHIPGTGFCQKMTMHFPVSFFEFIYQQHFFSYGRAQISFLNLSLYYQAFYQ
jgi:hypothetical protein